MLNVADHIKLISCGPRSRWEFRKASSFTLFLSPFSICQLCFILDYQHEIINAVQILSPYQVVLYTFWKTKLGLQKYTMHNKFSNFLYFASFLCSSLCNADQFQLQWREQDLRQIKPRNFSRHPFNGHFGRARIAEGVSKQKSHPL